MTYQRQCLNMDQEIGEQICLSFYLYYTGFEISCNI
jgi:hypothetical protein